LTLLQEKCAHAASALDDAAITGLLAEVAGWSVHGGTLCRDFAFDDYAETLGFVNALAWIVQHEDHHPELTLTYRNCLVRFQTHSAGGAISRNDFICAAKANAIYDARCGG
jgi:4a-hydroxytetrahydrobiopterin dehydratase